MKTTIKTTAITLVMLFATLFTTNTVNAQTTEKTYIKIVVDGLSCPFCAYGLEKNLKKLKGAKDVFISVEEGYTTFNVPKESRPTEDELKKIVKDAGFTAREISFSDKPFTKDEK